jgi:hypothetical protein
MPLIKLWTGHIIGTNTGNISVALDGLGPRVSGTVRLSDDRYGLAVYVVSGSYDGVLRLHGELTHSSSGMVSGSIEVTATPVEHGSFRGQWKSSIGMIGTFEVEPQDVAVAEQELDSENGLSS